MTHTKTVSAVDGGGKTSDLLQTNYYISTLQKIQQADKQNLYYFPGNLKNAT